MCMKELGASLNNTVLVGDTDNDALGAKDVGIPFIAVTYGFGFSSEADLFSYPHIGVAKTPAEILEIIKRHNA